MKKTLAITTVIALIFMFAACKKTDISKDASEKLLDVGANYFCFEVSSEKYLMVTYSQDDLTAYAEFADMPYIDPFEGASVENPSKCTFMQQGNEYLTADLGNGCYIFTAFSESTLSAYAFAFREKPSVKNNNGTLTVTVASKSYEFNELSGKLEEISSGESPDTDTAQTQEQ